MTESRLSFLNPYLLLCGLFLRTVARLAAIDIPVLVVVVLVLRIDAPIDANYLTADLHIDTNSR